jgi:hypothetical protein
MSKQLDNIKAVIDMGVRKGLFGNTEAVASVHESYNYFVLMEENIQKQYDNNQLLQNQCRDLEEQLLKKTKETK